MILKLFLLGACVSLYLCFFVVAYVNRSDKAPYREAFAWLGLVSALQCFMEVVGYLFPELGIYDQKYLCNFFDSLCVPFLVLELDCICRQDMKVLPWRKRWLQVVLGEIPLILIFAIALFTDGEFYLIMMYIWVSAYLLTFAILMVRSLKEYNNLLSYAKDGMNPSKNWAMWIFGVSVTIIVIYSILYPYFKNPMIESAYLVCNMLLNSVNAYFVWRQRPENAKELANIKSILQEERDIIKDKIDEMEKHLEDLSEKKIQMDALSSEMKQNAEKLKRKASIKEYMDTMRLQYPMFESNMNKIAEVRLTNHDMLLCMLILEGRKVSYIAKMTGVNVKSVEMGRSRLRKKLKLSAQDNLNEFIRSQVS